MRGTVIAPVQGDLEMFNETNQIFGKDLQHRFEAAQIHVDPRPVFQTSMAERWRDIADLGNDAAKEIAVLLGMAEAYERAVQALRDVRHLLPPEGVAIVDAALDCAT
jgi:hypothetical protein